MANNHRITQPPSSGFRSKNSVPLASNQSKELLNDRPKREFGSWEHNAWRRRRAIKYGPVTWEDETAKLIDCYSRTTPAMYQHNVKVAEWYKGCLNRLYSDSFDTKLIRPAHYRTAAQLPKKQRTKKEERGTGPVKRKRTTLSRTLRIKECKSRKTTSYCTGLVNLDRPNHTSYKDRRSFSFQEQSPNPDQLGRACEKAKRGSDFYVRSIERASFQDQKGSKAVEKAEEVEFCLCGHWMEDSEGELEEEVEEEVKKETKKDENEDEEWSEIGFEDEFEVGSVRWMDGRSRRIEDDFVMI